MRTFTNPLARALFVAVAILGTGSASAAVIYEEGSNTSTIPGLTGFATTGAMMNNLSVTATFSSGSETVLWAQTGADSGGVTGTGWSLTLSGDTFSATWNFTFTPGADLGGLQSLFLDGRTSFTVFDRTEPSPGTPGSAQGFDWAFVSGPYSDAVVRYDYEVNIGASPAVGDLWQTVFVDFVVGDLNINNPPMENFGFRQDTDNDARLNQVPEPGTLALLGIALGAGGFARRWISRRR